MITKYAKADIIDIKGSPNKRTASLSNISSYDDYRTNDGFMYVRIRAQSSRVNLNYDGWPSIELAGSKDILDKHMKTSSEGSGFTIEAKDGNDEYGFKTFLGKPIFVDHNNSDPSRTRGVVVDAKLNVLSHRESSLDPYWSSSDVDPEHIPATEIELLLEVDAKKFPKFAKAIKNGDIDGFSMGCNVRESKCNICNNVAKDASEFCSHIISKGAEHDYKTSDGKRISKKSYENVYGIQYFEISGVFTPADETALTKEVISAIQKEGIIEDVPGGAQLPDPLRGQIDQEVNQLARQLVNDYGISYPEALQEAQEHIELNKQVPSNGASPVINYETHPEGMYPQMTPEMQNQIGQMPNYQGSAKTSENALPQSFNTKAPEPVDTLRDIKTCPVCGNTDMEDGKCKLCGYIEPPEGMGNPDLTKARQIQDQTRQTDEMATLGENATEQDAQAGLNPGSYLQSRINTSNSKSFDNVINDMRRWQPEINPRVAGRINKIEKPLLNVPKPISNEPEVVGVVKDQLQPVTSAMLNAQALIRAAQQNQGEIMNKKADGATAPEPADKRVDVTGIGGVMDANNESASKADAQVDVTGIGGTGVEGVEADSTEDLPTAPENGDDAGFNKDKTTEDSGPTKTYGDSDGTEKGFTDPVTKKPFPESSVRQAYDNNPFPDDEIEGGSAVKGVSPADPVGNASERVDVLDYATSPSNNSGNTKTWSGTDGNGVLRQQDPVTRDTVWNNTDNAWTSHIVAAMKLADIETDLGLINQDEKYNRITELEHQTDDQINAQLETLAKVKTAGLNKLAQRTAGATKFPRLFGQRTAAPQNDYNAPIERVSTANVENVDTYSEDVLDSALFGGR